MSISASCRRCSKVAVVESGSDGLAECHDAVGDALQLQALFGGGVQLALLGRQGVVAAVQFFPLALEFGQGDDLGQVRVQ
jgi:hypothetical protein